MNYSLFQSADPLKVSLFLAFLYLYPEIPFYTGIQPFEEFFPPTLQLDISSVLIISCFSIYTENLQAIKSFEYLVCIFFSFPFCWVSQS